MAPTDLADNTRREIVNVLTKMGFEVEASHHEVAVGQHEIDFKYDEVLRACDKIQIFKLVVKTIARKHGLYAPLWLNQNLGSPVPVCTAICPCLMMKETMPSLIQMIQKECSCQKLLITSLVV